MPAWLSYLCGLAFSSRESLLAAEIERLRVELAEADERLRAESSKVRVLELEQELLLDVAARDRLRVKAESQGYAAQIVLEEKPRQ